MNLKSFEKIFKNFPKRVKIEKFLASLNNKT